jgi:phosphoserine phosphatase
MSYKAIVSDWNGSLFEYPTDEVQNKKLAYAVLDDAKHAVLKGRIWRVIDVVKLLKTKSELKKRLQQYYDGERHLWEVYEPFNENVLKGRPVSFVNKVIDKYARESADKLDERVIRPIQSVHREGKRTAILSVSYDYSIRRILEKAGYPYVFDDIVANTLQTDGNRVVGLTLEIYERKPEVLKTEFFEKRGLREDDTLYLGDSEDDESIAEILVPGNFIVPFFASDEFKQRLASKHKAFVPESEEDLLKYLQSK